MPCDICGHTVQNIGATDRQMYWCPRCGSLKTVMGDHSDLAVPGLVDQLKGAEDVAMRVPKDGPYPIGWIVGHIRWMGIREAIGRDPHRGETT